MSSDSQALKAQTIIFSNGNTASAVLPTVDTSVHEVLSLLDIPSFDSLIMLVGGAALMDEAQSSHLKDLFASGLAHFAVQHKALIIDGGTHAGVMKLMGEGVASQQHRSPLLGVSPGRRVMYPGKILHGIDSSKLTDLDPNHSHFVLVDTDQWGGETSYIYELAQLYAQNRPSVGVVVNGGSVALKEVLYNVRQGRPVVLLAGSGRLADELAELWQEKPASFSDPDLAEIIQHGNLHVFPVTGSNAAFIQLLEGLLQ